MLEVAKGMQYIHSEGIVHGDLRGVRVLVFTLSIHLIYLSFTRRMCSWMIFTVELLTLDYHDISTLLFRKSVPRH